MPWVRPSRNGNRLYDGQARDRINFALYLNQQHNDEPFFTKPIHIDVTFYMPVPKLLKDRALSIHHIGSPNLENLNKFLLEVIREIIIADARVISSFSSKKMYAKEPRTEIRVIEVK